MTHDSGPLTVDLWCLFQPELLKSLSDILVHGGNSNVARRQSALQLKNFLSSNDEATRHIYQQVKSSDIQSFSYNLIRIFFVFMCQLHISLSIHVITSVNYCPSPLSRMILRNRCIFRFFFSVGWPFPRMFVVTSRPMWLEPWGQKLTGHRRQHSAFSTSPFLNCQTLYGPP